MKKSTRAPAPLNKPLNPCHPHITTFPPASSGYLNFLYYHTIEQQHTPHLRTQKESLKFAYMRGGIRVYMQRVSCAHRYTHTSHTFYVLGQIECTGVRQRRGMGARRLSTKPPCATRVTLATCRIPVQFFFFSCWVRFFEFHVFFLRGENLVPVRGEVSVSSPRTGGKKGNNVYRKRKRKKFQVDRHSNAKVTRVTRSKGNQSDAQQR